MRVNKIALLGVLLLINMLVVAAVPSNGLESKSATKNVIIRFDKLQGADTDKDLKSLGCSDTFVSQLIPIITAKCPKNSINSITKRKGVKSVRDEIIYHALLTSSVPQINGILARNTFGVNGSGVIVAVLDTGINSSHQSLVGRVILEKDFTGSGTTDDIFDHGTPVACVIACVNDTYVGVAPGASLLNGKVLDNGGGGTDGQIIAGIEWALNNSARVISMSIGAGVADCNGNDAMSLAVNAAFERGAAMVVGAGNGGGVPGSAEIWSPGCAENALTVGSVSDANTMSSFSSRGPTDDGRVKPDVVAPGETIVAARHTFDFSTYSGTSFSTPHVSGIAALMIEARSKLYPDEVKRIIRETALNLSFHIYEQGYGLVNALEAVNKSLQVVDAANFSNLTPAHPVKPAVNSDFVLNASVFNNGNTETNNTNITLTLPAGMTLVSGASTQSIGNIIPRTTGPTNATWVVRITQKANQTVTLDAIGGPLPASLQKTFVIEPAFANFANLGISYPNVPEVNTTFDLNASVANNGTADANGTTVMLTLPAGTVLVSGANPQSIGQVAPGATGIATWTVKVLEKANQTVTVNATSTNFEASTQGMFVVVPGYAKFTFDNVFPATVNKNTIFNANTTITNIGTIATDNADATIILSDGFRLAPLEDFNKLLGTINAGEAKSTGWRVKAFKFGTWPIWINATSTKENAMTTFNITVV